MEEWLRAEEEIGPEPLLTKGEIVEGEIPDVRKNATSAPPIPSWLGAEACVLSGIKAPQPSKAEDAPSVPSVPLRVRYGKFCSGSIYNIWAEQDEHYGSGLPVYLQSLVEGSEGHEKDVVNYCKLAGLKYKTSKDKMKSDIDKMKSDVNQLTTKMVASLDSFVVNYKQMENE